MLNKFLKAWANFEFPQKIESTNIFVEVKIFHRHHDEDIMIQRAALLWDYLRPKYVHQSRLSIFLDGWLKALSKTIIDNVCAGERVTTSLLQSNYILFTEAIGIFLRAEIDTVKNMFQARDLIVILSYRSYFVYSLVLGPNQCTVFFMSMNKGTRVS